MSDPQAPIYTGEGLQALFEEGEQGFVESANDPEWESAGGSDDSSDS